MNTRQRRFIEEQLKEQQSQSEEKLNQATLAKDKEILEAQKKSEIEYNHKLEQLGQKN